MDGKISAENIRVPISHDGIHDSLTYLASSGLFYEILYREISRAARDQSPLVLFRFLLRFPTESFTIREVEESLVDFAQTLTMTTRGSDVSARIGGVEFLSLMSIDEKLVMGFIGRVAARWGDSRVRFTYSYLSLPAGASPHEIFRELDNAEIMEV